MSGPARIEPAGPVQAAVIAALQAACFPEDPWDETSIATLSGQPGAYAALALGQDMLGQDMLDPDTPDPGPAPGPGRPLGFLMARVAAEDAEIIAIGVLPDGRGRGVGRQLVAAALDGARARGATALFLEVAEDNVAARALYAACGFAAVGRRPAYYRRPGGRVAAVVLRRDLPAGPS